MFFSQSFPSFSNAADLYDLIYLLSCRSCQELSNEYLLAKSGVDTAENEPLKVHLIFKAWDLIFTEPPAPLAPWFLDWGSLLRLSPMVATILGSFGVEGVSWSSRNMPWKSLWDGTTSKGSILGCNALKKRGEKEEGTDRTRRFSERHAFDGQLQKQNDRNYFYSTTEHYHIFLQ